MSGKLTNKRIAEILARAEVCDDSVLTDYADIAAAMRELQEFSHTQQCGSSSAGGSNNCRSNENMQEVQVQSGTTRASEPAQSGSEFAVVPVNDVTTGKPLTIPLPDISSKAFWSGSGKAEVFHPETYRRWVKEAIERHCAIFGIGVRVK